MTDEQIKQNAEEYYDKLDSITIEVEDKPNTIIEAYITGAHSRDEEIKDLKLKLNKLSNPWISVKERLPAKYKLVLVKTGRGKCYLAEKDNFVKSLDEFALPQLSSYVDGVTHWMPIP